MIRAVILAAGLGRRMGSVAKAMLPLGQKTFLEAIATTMQAVGVVRPVVVIGPPHEKTVATHAAALGLDVVRNPRPRDGMASSVSVGFAALGSGAAAFLWPVDIPGVTPESLQALVAQMDPERVIVPTFEGRGGHPVLAGRALWPELSQCADEKEGARSVFRHNRDRLVRVAVEDRFVVRDVDRPGDLETLARPR